MRWPWRRQPVRETSHITPLPDRGSSARWEDLLHPVPAEPTQRLPMIRPRQVDRLYPTLGAEYRGGAAGHRTRRHLA